MRKSSLALLFLLLLLISSCNLPTSGETPTSDSVATQVAQLLTDQAVTLLPTVAMDTPQPTTPIKTEIVETNTKTPLPTPSATVPPEDPRALLGPADFVNTLDSGKSFGLDSNGEEDDYTFIRVENGELVLTSKYAIDWSGWRTGGSKIQNAYIEANTRVNGCASADIYGIVIRSPDYSRGYWFRITCGGNWVFGYWDGSTFISLKDGSSSAILSGSEQSNRLGVMMSGKLFKLYINGVLISEVEDATFGEAGYYGMVIAARETPNFTVYTDDFSIWELD
jgi:hypothetical protein